MAKILVTGGEGFIGSALCARLVKEGHEVFSMDNQSTGFHRPKHPDVYYINGDASLINFYKGDAFEYVFHFGEYSRVESSFEDYDDVLNFNHNNFPKILDFCKNTGAKLIYSGSSTKFGDNGPSSSPYAFTKAQNTEMLKAYAEWFGLDYSIVYFHNVYGPGETSIGRYATVIGSFLDKVKSGTKWLPVTSPGTQLRNFTHINDTVDGILLAAFKASGDGFRIGSDEKFNILDVVDMMKCKVDMKGNKKGNRMDATLDNSKLKELGWECKHSLPDYIASEINESNIHNL